MALRLRQWAHQIKVKGGKTTIRHLKRRQRSAGVSGDLGALASQAGPAERLDLRGHLLPHITASHVAEEGVASLVDEAVGALEDARDQCRRDDWTRS